VTSRRPRRSPGRTFASFLGPVGFSSWRGHAGLRGRRASATVPAWVTSRRQILQQERLFGRRSVEYRQSARMRTKFMCIPSMRLFVPELMLIVPPSIPRLPVDAPRRRGDDSPQAPRETPTSTLAARGCSRHARGDGKQSSLFSWGSASLRISERRVTSSCRRLILRKAGFTNRRYSIQMHLFTLLMSLRILPNWQRQKVRVSQLCQQF
jgi:hypothetical protein